MFGSIFIDKSYSIRHKILGVLYNDWETHNHESDRQVGSIRIANTTNIPIADIYSFQYLLLEKGEIVISDNDGQSMMSIQQIGISAYVDKRYIKEGIKNRWDRIFDWARIVIPLGALILSITNYYSNKTLMSKIKALEEKIEKIKK